MKEKKYTETDIQDAKDWGETVGCEFMKKKLLDELKKWVEKQSSPWSIYKIDLQEKINSMRKKNE